MFENVLSRSNEQAQERQGFNLSVRYNHPMIATSKKIRFTVDEYFRMSDAGVLDGQRVELLEGRIVRMHAQAHPHRWTVSKARHAFDKHFPRNKFWVMVQSTLLLGRHGAPEPDIHIFLAPEGTAERLLPKPFLVLEVSDTTYRKDSGIKLRQYAAAGIQDYWIVNLTHRRIEVYRTPTAPDAVSGKWHYEHRRDFTAGESIALHAYPEIQIAVDDIIP